MDNIHPLLQGPPPPHHWLHLFTYWDSPLISSPACRLTWFPSRFLFLPPFSGSSPAQIFRGNHHPVWLHHKCMIPNFSWALRDCWVILHNHTWPLSPSVPSELLNLHQPPQSPPPGSFDSTDANLSLRTQTPLGMGSPGPLSSAGTSAHTHSWLGLTFFLCTMSSPPPGPVPLTWSRILCHCLFHHSLNTPLKSFLGQIPLSLQIRSRVFFTTNKQAREQAQQNTFFDLEPDTWASSYLWVLSPILHLHKIKSYVFLGIQILPPSSDANPSVFPSRHPHLQRATFRHEYRSSLCFTSSTSAFLCHNHGHLCSHSYWKFRKVEIHISFILYSPKCPTYLVYNRYILNHHHFREIWNL